MADIIKVLLVTTCITLAAHTISWFFEAWAGDFRNWIRVTGLFFLASLIALVLSIVLS